MSFLVKVAGQHLPTMEIVLARSVVTLALSVGWLRYHRMSVWGSRRPLLYLRGLLGFLGLACFFYSVTHLPLAEATVIHHTHPIFTSILAALFLKEGVGGRLLVTFGMSFAGVLLLTQPEFLGGGNTRVSLFAVSVALGGAIASAAAYVTVRKLRETDHPYVIVFYFPLVALPLTVPWVVGNFVMPYWWEFFLLLAIGIVTQAAQILMTRGLSLLPAGRGTTIGLSQIAFASFWGIVLFSEIPQFWPIVGAFLVAGGTLFAMRGAVAAKEQFPQIEK